MFELYSLCMYVFNFIKSAFLAVSVSLRWLNNVNCLCHSRLSQVEYNCTLIKVDWFAACIELRVAGPVLVVSSGVSGIHFAQSNI
jgi:hypothetical protein